MSQALVDCPKNSTQADLAAIAANASFLWERLDAERFVVDRDQLNEQEINRRLERWCEVVGQGNWDTLQKRLQWEGFDLETVRPRLGTVKLAADQPLPAWAETLQQIIQAAAAFEPSAEVLLPIDSKTPIPFEDILLAVVSVARKKLLARLGSTQLTPDALPLSLLAIAAYHSLERSLLQQLAGICAKTLDFEFSQVRPFGHSLLRQLGLEAEDSHPKTHYTNFVNQQLQDGLLSFFQKYPVLARLVATTLDFWVESTAEFLQRLAADREDIQQLFGSKTANELQDVNQRSPSLSKVTEITASLSDPHNQGRAVLVLTFASGLKIVYKPKDLQLEVGFTQFLDWCNRHSQLLAFKVIQVLNRDGYGWVEYIEQQPCADEAAAQRFYQRSGMLLCLLYALRGTDCHNENLIASGEHLVLVDMETLLHHESRLMEDLPEFQEVETIAAHTLLDSVLRTGLLPNWDFSPDNRIAYDISGLGSTDLQQVPRKVLRWQAINTDDMYLRFETMMFPLEKNVPFLGDQALSPNDYQAQIATGFEQMYRFLIAQKPVLLSSASPLAGMQQQVRFVFRATQIYGTIAQNSLAPDFFKHGADYSIALDVLSRAFLIAQAKPDAWPILGAELRAMEQLDIPYFSASTASDGLRAGDHQTIPCYFKQPSYQQVLSQLQLFNETDLTRQLGIIQGSLDAKVARIPTGESRKWETESLPLLTSEQLIQEARTIADAIATKSIQDPDGSVNWIGLGYAPEAERFQLRVLNEGLYDGRCGIALLMAALYRVTGEQRFHDLALGALQSLRRRIETFAGESQQRFARLTGIGAATGLGSMVYTLVNVSQLLEDKTLLHDAQELANWITPERIAADQQFDVFGGAAGAMLGLLSLHAATGEATVLETAIACGQHLLTHQISYAGSPKAWQTPVGDRPLAGFSHGAAGIAYALLRLYAVTQNQDYLNAALEGIEYERSVFSKSACNWPDFRMMGLSGQPSFVSQWCHGASGIGLGRLGSLGIVQTPDIEREIEIALQTTQTYGLQKVDHLCCGNLGRAELLLVAAQHYPSSEWRCHALQQVTNVVARARSTGAYQLFSNLPNNVFSPGFFQGTAGIGYQLLRFACDDLPSVLLWK